MNSQQALTNEFYTDSSKPEIVLIFPKTIELEFISVDIPYSIFFVGSYLRKFGYPVKLFDHRKTSFRFMLKYIREHNVRYVGVSTMTGPQLLFAEGEVCEPATLVKNDFTLGKTYNSFLKGLVNSFR